MDDPFFKARWWLKRPILDAHTLSHFGQTKVWVEKDRDACSLFLPSAFFFCGFLPLCLELTTGFSHRWVPAVSVWGRLLPWLMAYSRLCKLFLQLVFVTLSWSTTIALSFLELAEEDCFGHAYVFHPCDVLRNIKVTDGVGGWVSAHMPVQFTLTAQSRLLRLNTL